MALQLTIDYEQLLQLVEQLSDEQREALMNRLIRSYPRKRGLTTVEEKIALLNRAKVNNPINEAPSIRREDWYGDDGR